MTLYHSDFFCHSTFYRGIIALAIISQFRLHRIIQQTYIHTYIPTHMYVWCDKSDPSIPRSHLFVDRAYSLLLQEEHQQLN